MSASDPPEDDRTVIRPAAPLPAHAKTLAVPIGDRTVAVASPPPFELEHGNGLPIGTRLGEFEITAMVGEGGFGIVYEVYDHSLQRRVALKEYMPSALAARTSPLHVSVKSERHRETFEAGRKSFVTEARLLASFDHPSLVKVYRFWEANGTAYMVMPFLEGITLKDRLKSLGAPPDEAWLKSVLAPVTEALMVIHAERCYHRDIAPDNIMQLASNQRWIVLDFGAARRVIGDMTQALTVILKPGYAPVEQYAEIPGMKQGPWTDVYALSAVVYFAIMGRTPPPSVGRLLNDTYVPLVEAAAGRFAPDFLAAVDRGLVVRPEGRTQTIDEMRAQMGLHEVLTATPYTTRPFAPGDVPARPGPATGFNVPTTALPPKAAARAPAPAAAAAAPASVAATPASKLPLYAGLGVLVVAGLGFGAWKLTSAPPPPAAAPVAATPAAVAPAPPPASAVVVAPPSAAEPAPAPVASAQALVPAVEFQKVVQAATPGFSVAAISDKPTLKIGRDEFAFTVQSPDREGYLYVFAAGSDGELVLLVPNATSGAVRLKKGQRYHFPTGDGVALDATEPAGPVQLLTIVAARPRDYSELEPKALGTMRLFPSGPAAAGQMARHQGPKPILTGRTVCPASGACEDDYGAAVVRFETVK